MQHLSVLALVLALATHEVQAYTSSTLGHSCYSSINCWGSEVCQYGVCSLPYYYSSTSWLATKYIIILAVSGCILLLVGIYACIRYRRRQRSIVTVVGSNSVAPVPGSGVDAYPKPTVPGEQLPPYTPTPQTYPSAAGPQPYYGQTQPGNQPWPQQPQGYYYPPPTYPQNQSGPGVPESYPQYPNTQPPQQYPPQYPQAPRTDNQSTHV
eukprot:comp24094_c0_seq1/m.43455 comp24094_c0_seq1/g.43455  ORF comp24094_c0_seq1/g.43455 comp24094_c0_seq1/m.43455 type:complete len:209 (-) comp24094_c0_seq1:590-1216(-)